METQTGQRIREIREKLRISIAEMGRRVGVSGQLMGQYESVTTGTFSFPLLRMP